MLTDFSFSQPDVNRMSEHEERNSFLLEKITIAEMVIAVCLALITTTGNLMVVITVYKDPYKELRTSSNFLVVNLAAADLIVGFIVEPLWALQYWVETDKSYSIASYLLIVLSVDASCLTVMFLTIERYIVLERPLGRETIFTTLAIKIIIFLIWLTAVVISFLLIPFWKRRWYNLFLFTGIGCFLLLFMFCLYFRMFLIIRRFNNTILAQGTRQRLIQPDEASVMARKREQEVAKAIFLFVGTFALCWLPFVVTETIQYTTTTKISAHVLRAVLFIGLLNSALNPILYTFRMHSFRRALRRILRSRNSELAMVVQ